MTVSRWTYESKYPSYYDINRMKSCVNELARLIISIYHGYKASCHDTLRDHEVPKLYRKQAQRWWQHHALRMGGTPFHSFDFMHKYPPYPPSREKQLTHKTVIINCSFLCKKKSHRTMHHASPHHNHLLKLFSNSPQAISVVLSITLHTHICIYLYLFLHVSFKYWLTISFKASAYSNLLELHLKLCVVILITLFTFKSWICVL